MARRDSAVLAILDNQAVYRFDVLDSVPMSIGAASTTDGAYVARLSS